MWGHQASEAVHTSQATSGAGMNTKRPIYLFMMKNTPLSGPEYSLLEAPGTMGNQVRREGHYIHFPWNGRYPAQKPGAGMINAFFPGIQGCVGIRR